MYECPKAVPEDPQYEKNLPQPPLYAGGGVHGTLRFRVAVRTSLYEREEPMMANLSQLVQDERTARMALSMIVEPDDAVTGRLLGEVGAVEVLRLAKRDDGVPGLGTVDARVWRAQFERPDAQTHSQRIVEAQRMGIGVLIPGDQDWPSALDDLGDRRPYVLWTRGATSFLARPLSEFVTITGARAATSYGEHVAGQLSSDLANAERVVVAGGAYGIEGAAHRAALASGGDTIAVMANGVDRPYPVGHRELLERVADLGLMVSEVPPGAVPTRHRFLARARLMAALSAATAVVEAGARSGSLAVAQRAHELGRIVGAVPGPITSATSVGSNHLLAERLARVISHADDVVRRSEKAETKSLSPGTSAHSLHQRRDLPLDREARRDL